jgi:hypothetical protein
MSSRVRKLAWFPAAVGIHAASIYAAVHCCFYVSVLYLGGAACSSTCDHTTKTYTGYPLHWYYESQNVSMSYGGRVVYRDVLNFHGQNSAYPFALILLAICLPSVLIDLPARRLANRATPTHPGPSRLIRLNRVGVLVALAGLTVTAVDLLTSHSDDAYAILLHPPANRLQGEAEYYRIINRIREWRTGQDCENRGGVRVCTVPTPDWAARSLTTAGAMGLGLVIGCVLFRPWRRPTSLPSPADTPATTAPA